MLINSSYSLNGVVHRNEQENPQSCNSEGFRFAYGNLPHSLAMLIICQNRKKSTKKKKDINLNYVCDLLIIPNVLSIIKSIKISDRVLMHLKLKEENHEKSKFLSLLMVVMLAFSIVFNWNGITCTGGNCKIW